MGAIIEGRERSHSERENIFLRGERVSEKIQIHRLSELHFPSFLPLLPDVDSFSGSKVNVLLTKEGEREKRRMGKKVCEFEHLVDFRKSDYKSGKYHSYSHKYQYSHSSTSFLMRLFQVRETERSSFLLSTSLLPILRLLSISLLPVLRLLSNPDTNGRNKSVW